MYKIFKYPLLVQGVQEVELPFGAEILTVQAQETHTIGGQIPMLWAQVQPEVGETQTRTIRTIVTGHPIEDDGTNLKYIGTYQLNDTDEVFVGHVFEVLS